MTLRTVVPEGVGGAVGVIIWGRRKFQGGGGIATVKRVELLAVRAGLQLAKTLGCV